MNFFAKVAAFGRRALEGYKSARHNYMKFVEAHPGRAVTIQTITLAFAAVGAWHVVPWIFRLVLRF